MSDSPGHPNLTSSRWRPPLQVMRVREELGFHPRFTIESGIARYAEWIRSGGAEERE